MKNKKKYIRPVSELKNVESMMLLSGSDPTDDNFTPVEGDVNTFDAKRLTTFDW